jgi:hypothetical protein
MRDLFSMVTNLFFGFRESNDAISPGESLLQHVLDDPLLALARADGEPAFHVRCYICLSPNIDPSFQVLHAVHSMERLLDEMLRRSAIFDIVFWSGKLIVVSRRFISENLICFQILATSR